MSNDRRPIARLTFRRDKQTFNILTIWPGKFPGTYDIARDKPTDKYQTIGLFDALKSWGTGEGFLGFTVESERERRDGGRQQGGSGGDSFSDDSIPF